MKVTNVLLVLCWLTCSFNLGADEIKPVKIPRTEVFELLDEHTNNTYPILIKLPKSYNNKTQHLYPIIYLTDAPYSFQIVSGSTRFPMNTKKMKEAIIVGISYSKGSKGASSRIRDYTHISNQKWRLETGKANSHITFIQQFLFPFMEKNYRVDTTNKTFVGNSLGGLFGAYILFSKPEMFNNYILGSPSTWFSNNHILKTEIKGSNLMHNVFIAVGELESPELGDTRHDMVNGARALAAKISKSTFPNTNVKLLEIRGANHETAFPTTAIQGLYWLLKTN